MARPGCRDWVGGRCLCVKCLCVKYFCVEVILNKQTTTIIRWLVTLAMPFFIGLGGIKLLVGFGPGYVNWEYNKASFPNDVATVAPETLAALNIIPLTQAERTELALVAVDYLRRSEPAEEVIYLLEDQTLPVTNLPLYNEAEIGHMLDVKHLTDGIGTIVWVVGVIVVGGVGLLLWKEEARPAGYLAIRNGGIATTGILLVIALFILLAWQIFFVQFHELLFPPGTWTFAYTDGLIRLFPEKFWFDAGVLMSMVPLVDGILVAIVGQTLLKRAKSS